MANNTLQPLSIDEVAHFLAVSPRTVRRLIDDGALPPVRIGATLALEPSALPTPLAEAIRRTPRMPLLRLHQVAERLCCSPNRVRKLVRDGTLPPITVGRSQRWAEDAVRAYAEGGAHDDAR